MFAGTARVFSGSLFPRRGGVVQGDGRRSAVPAKADTQQVEQVSPVARYQLQAAVTVVAPADAEFLDPVAAPLRQVEDFDVEHVAVDALAVEQVTRHRGAEPLEATLRVADVPQTDDQVHQDRKPLRAEPAV